MKIAIFEKNIITRRFASYSANYVVLPNNVHADLLILLNKANEIIDKYSNQISDLNQIRVKVVDTECSSHTLESISLIIKLTTSFRIVMSEPSVAKTRQELLPDFIKQFVNFDYDNFLDESNNDDNEEENPEDYVSYYEQSRINRHSLQGSIKVDNLPASIMIAIDSWTNQW